MARFNNQFVRNQTAPATPYTYALCKIPIQAVTFALGALETRAAETTWIDNQNWQRGRHLIRELQVALLMGEDMEELNRIYRLLDTIFNGQEYTVTSQNPLVISPAIPDVPNTIPNENGIKYMIDNLPGIVNPGWFGVGGQKATLADIVRGLSVGKQEAQENIWETVQGILDAGGDVTNVADFVAELVTGTAEITAEGGIMVAIAGSMVANTVMQQGIMAMLSRLIRSIDGGGIGLPSDNVLMALRGTNPANTERNVIDAQEDGEETQTKLNDILTKIDQGLFNDEQIEQLLAAIRDKVS